MGRKGETINIMDQQSRRVVPYWREWAGEDWNMLRGWLNREI